MAQAAETKTEMVIAGNDIKKKEQFLKNLKWKRKQEDSERRNWTLRKAGKEITRDSRKTMRQEVKMVTRKVTRKRRKCSRVGRGREAQ